MAWYDRITGIFNPKEWLKTLTEMFQVETLEGVWTNITQWCGMAFFKILPAAGLFLANVVLGLIGKMREGIVKVVLIYVQGTTRIKLDEKMFTGKGAMELSEAMQKAMGKGMLDQMLNLIMPEPPLTPEKGKEAAENFLNVNLAFQLDAWIMHLISDFIPIFKPKSFKDLPNAISWSFGIGWLSWLVMGTPFRKGIADPLEIFYNRVYQPEVYTTAQLCRLRNSMFITENEFFEGMMDIGYSKEKAVNLWKDSLKDYSDTDLRRLYYSGVLSSEEVTENLLKRGYSEKKAESLGVLITSDRTSKLREDLVDETLRCYREETLNKDQVRSILAGEGWSDNDIGLALTKEEFTRYHRRELTVGQTGELLKYNLIDGDEYNRRMQRIGYAPEDLELLDSLAKIKAEISAALRVYWTRRTQLQKSLTALGVEEWWYILDKLKGDELRIGRMSKGEWGRYMHYFLEPYR